MSSVRHIESQNFLVAPRPRISNQLTKYNYRPLGLMVSRPITNVNTRTYDTTRTIKEFTVCYRKLTETVRLVRQARDVERKLNADSRP